MPETLVPENDPSGIWSRILDGVEDHGGPARLYELVQSRAAQHALTHAAPGRTPPLDPLPLLIPADQWSRIDAGVRQRARLHEALLRDLCGPRRVIGDGGIPPDLLVPHPAARLALSGAGGTRLHRLACDVARNADGSWTVISDRADGPSGLGLALLAREVSTEFLGDVLATAGVRHLDDVAIALRQSLQASAPPSAGTSPAVGVLISSSGPAAADAECLAERLDVPSVRAADVTAGTSGVFSERHGRLHVLLRQVLATACDPIEDPGAIDGVPGLVESVRTRAVSLCNPLGGAIIDSPALLSILPRLCRTLLGEELSLPSAVTYWCGERAMCSHVIAHLTRLVIRPAHTTRTGSAIRGWELSIDEQADLAARIAVRPWAWVGQEPVEAGTTSVVTDEGVAQRPVMVRTFAVGGGGDHRVVPGGLGRVADEEFFTSTRRAKDVWVLDPEGAVA